MTRPGKPKLKTIMWRLMQNRKVVTYDDLQELAGVSRSYAQEWMATLVKREVVRKLSNGRFQLIGDIVSEPKTIGSTVHLKFKDRPRGVIARKIDVLPETKLWQAILKLKKFRLIELVEMNLANKTTAYQYCAALVRAGFLKKDRKKRKSNQCVYSLAKVTGDAAPVIGRALYLYDPNTDRIWDDVPVAGDIKKHLTG